MGEPGIITREHAIACAQNVARHQGYAIGVHGSRVRDVDLIAVPWIEGCAITPQVLAEMIAEALPGVLVGGWERKPHGRQGITIYPKWRWGFDSWYIDLSVMHRHRARARASQEGE